MSRAVELLILLVVLLLVGLSLSLYLRLFPQTFYRDKPVGLCTAELDDKPNWVSSLVKPSNAHYTAPLPVSPLSIIAKAIEHLDPNTYFVIHPYYIEGYRRTHFFGFTDWFCINDMGHITSSATLGYSDLSKNRQWVNALRAQLDKVREI